MKHTLLSIPFLLFYSFSFSQFDFSPSSQVGTTGTNPQYITTGDINNDGYDDILVGLRNTSTSETFTLQLFTNDLNNSGTFIKSNVTNTLSDIIGLTIADLNDDGFNDIVAAGAANGILAWYPNNQSGVFPTQNIISATLSGPVTIVVADINNSNTPDVITAAYGTGETIWFSNDGSGNFSAKNVIAVDAASGPIDLDIGDLDGDGDLDVVVGYYVTGAVQAYDNNLIGSGTVSFTKYSNAIETSSIALYDVLFADVNDDGSLDIVRSDLASSVSNSTGAVSYYTKNGNSISTTFNKIPLVEAAPQRPASVIVDDFTGDGFNDVVYVDAVPGSIYGFQSTDLGTFMSPVLIEDLPNVVYGIAKGDFDGDGILDIAAANNNGKTINIIINDVVLGIEDYTPSTIKMFPNPVSQILTFEGLDPQKRELSIYNNLGQTIIETSLNLNNQIDVSNLNMGLYFMKFKNYVGTFKFIKE